MTLNDILYVILYDMQIADGNQLELFFAIFKLTSSNNFISFSDVVPCWNKIVLRRSTDDGGSGL